MNWKLLFLVVLLVCASIMDMTQAGKKSPPPKKKKSPPPSKKNSPPIDKQVRSSPPPPKQKMPPPTRRERPPFPSPSPPAPTVEGLYGTPYAYEMVIRADGLVPNNNGLIEPANTGSPELALDFMRERVVRARGGGTDEEVAAFRRRAFEFFHERFGIEIPKDLDEKALDDIIYISEDSYILPAIIGTDSGSKMTFFRNRDTMTYLDHADVRDAGFWMFVGETGLPAGGTYNTSLLPSARAGFGAMVAQGGCPDLYLPTIESGTKVCYDAYHAQGWITLTYQTEMPQYLMLHEAWSSQDDFYYGSPAPAQMFPVHLTILEDPYYGWGTGSCHGSYYAVVVNYEWFKLISNMVCTFTARTSWENFFPEHEGLTTL